MEPSGPPGGMDTLGLDFPKNPLLCPICHDYFTEPCILSCYHTFCARCLRGREQDRRLICPFCRQPTMLKDGTALPPADTLMRQLIDIANSENPPCSNCDKRDRQNMYYCNTCGQALCCQCRDNTHRAKMFSSHEIVHMSKCMKEPKKCPQHGEHYIMYSPLQNGMLCVNCFRELPTEVRAQCVDIDTAYTQAAKRLERGQNTIMDLQTSVRDGIIALKGLMDELRRNMDSEKHTINTFCQGMQEAIAKTHATMIMEVQRQFECKDRIYRSQLLMLGTVMPVLQLHLVLCTTFTAAANKYQFLELCPALVDRLHAVGNLSQPVRSLQSSQIKTNYRSEFAQCLEPWIGPEAVSQHQSELAAASRMYDSVPPATKKQQSALKHKLLESDSSFASHCRSFESQIRELNQQFNVIKDKVGELHKDILALRKAHTPPLVNRYELLNRECLHLDQSLERQQQELDRMATAFDASWEEQLWRIRVEQEVFSCQRADVSTLRNELKHLSQMATQLEPYIRSLTPASQSQMSGQSEQSQTQSEQAQHLASLLEHIGIIHQQSESSLGKIPRSRSRMLGHLLEKVRPNMQERERSKSAGQTDKPALSTPAHKQQPPQQQLKKPFMSSSQQINRDRLEAQIKEKLHDIISRRQSSQPASRSDTETAAAGAAAAAERKMLSKDDRKLSKTDLDSIGSGKQRIMYKKIGKSCDKINGGGSKSDSECKKAAAAAVLRGGGAGAGTGEQPEYQRIADACGGGAGMKALLHTGGSRSSPSSPKGGKGRGPPPSHHHHHRTHQAQPGSGQATKQHRKKVYPYSDGEDNVFYGTRATWDSADSLSAASSRRSSYDGGGGGGGGGGSGGPLPPPPPHTDKTLVVYVNRRNKSVSSAGAAGGGGSTPTGGAHAQKQRSWETFPPKRRHQQQQHHHSCAGKERASQPQPLPPPSPPPMQPLRKADSFEGHEEAVKSLVAAVQETRRKPKGGN